MQGPNLLYPYYCGGKHDSSSRSRFTAAHAERSTGKSGPFEEKFGGNISPEYTNIMTISRGSYD